MSTLKKLSAVPKTTKPTSLAYLVGRLDHILKQRLRDSLAPCGLSVPQYTALSVFRAHGSLSNAQLAARTKGWIARTPDPAHGRIIQISLTESGQAALDECDAHVAELEQLMFADLDEEAKATLQAQLRGAVRALSVQGL